MPFEYVSVDEAIARRGWRMVVVGGVPSPWGEAAKGILHIKGIDWAAVRLVYDSEPLKAWAGQRSGPVAIYDDERPRAGWAEILLLAERLAPTPALLPKDAAERALVFGLAHEICGEEGLGWTRRLQLIHTGLQGAGGFAPRVAALLGMLATRLKAQRAAGSRYYVGNALSAVDVYSATFMALFAPLPHEHCVMDASSRAAFETLDAATAAALDPMLLEH